MCDAERDLAERKNALKNKDGRVIAEDPHELEDLQMILSLEDDVDNEVLEDSMFREAKLFEVKEAFVHSAQKLSLSCKESHEILIL